MVCNWILKGRNARFSPIAQRLSEACLFIGVASLDLTVGGYLMSDEKVFTLYWKVLLASISVGIPAFIVAGCTNFIAEAFRENQKKTLKVMCITLSIVTLYTWAELGYRSAFLQFLQYDELHRYHQNMEEGGL